MVWDLRFEEYMKSMLFQLVFFKMEVDTPSLRIQRMHVAFLLDYSRKP
jgi:hypothetical protein